MSHHGRVAGSPQRPAAPADVGRRTSARAISANQDRLRRLIGELIGVILLDLGRERRIGWIHDRHPARGRGDRGHPGHACGGAVRHGPGLDRDEHGDRHGRQGHRDHGHRDPDRDHPLHAGDGLADDHRWEDRRDHRSQACVRDRLRHLRLRLVHDLAGPEPDRADHRLVGPRGHRRGVDHARDRGAGRVELRQAGSSPRLRAGRGGGLDRRGPRAPDRRLLHHLRFVALGVRRRGADRARDPAPDPADEGHAARGGGQARPRRHGSLRGGARPDRARDPALGHLGLRAAEARGPGMARALAGDLDDPRGRRGAGSVRRLGEPAHRSRRGRSVRPRRCCATSSCAAVSARSSSCS